MMHYIIIFLDYIGLFGPLILFLFSVFLLWNKSNYLTYYVYGSVLNGLLTLILKGIFKQPRPSEDPKLFNLAIKESKRFKFIDGYPYDIFGMPSGHSSSVIFSTMFIFCVFKNNRFLLLYLLISMITMIQRITSNNHTFTQIIAGAFVGAIFSYLIFYMARQKIMGSLLLKKDDDGPI
jgi:membrane-associated phospholipid phosphatase